MRPVSEAFGRAVRSSHRMTARARVVAPGQTGVDPDGELVPIHDGHAEYDASAVVQGIAELVSSGAWPARAPGIFSPFGTELYLERGLIYGNGVTEWVGLGYFRIDTVEQAETPLGEIVVAGSDRMAGLEGARLERPIQLAATTTKGAAVEQLVTAVYPDAVIEWDDDTDLEQLGRTVVVERDRRKFLADLVTSAGKVWRWDHRGVLVIADAPTVAAPVAQLDAGPGGVLVNLSRSLTRQGIYNAVVVTGEAPDTAAPVLAVAVDDNPASPTYYHGPFGPVPRFFSSPLITTPEQAEKAARTMLVSALGTPYSIDLEAVPNPALEQLDPVTVRYPPAASDPTDLENEVHVLDRLRIPLTPEGPFIGRTRVQQPHAVEVVA